MRVGQRGRAQFAARRASLLGTPAATRPIPHFQWQSALPIELQPPFISSGRSPTFDPSDFQPVGRITAASGLRGGLRVKPLSAGFLACPDLGSSLPRNVLPVLQSAWLEHESGWLLVQPAAFESRGKEMVLTFAECMDRHHAEALISSIVWAHSDQWSGLQGSRNAPALSWQQLLGFSAYRPDGQGLGLIQQVQTNREHALLKVCDEWVPYVSQFVSGIDRSKRRLVLDWPLSLQSTARLASLD